ASSMRGRHRAEHARPHAHVRFPPDEPAWRLSTGGMTTTAADAARCALGDPGFTQRYRAIDARDTRFDGQFFTAVSSTGIYCRPSCPARTPKPEHVTFYLTSAAAHEA